MSCMMHADTVAWMQTEHRSIHSWMQPISWTATWARVSLFPFRCEIVGKLTSDQLTRDQPIRDAELLLGESRGFQPTAPGGVDLARTRSHMHAHALTCPILLPACLPPVISTTPSEKSSGRGSYLCTPCGRRSSLLRMGSGCKPFKKEEVL